MMKLDIDADEILGAFTEPCLNSTEHGGRWDGSTQQWVRPEPTCFCYNRCGRCFDGRILNEQGKKLAEMIRLFGGK